MKSNRQLDNRGISQVVRGINDPLSLCALRDGDI